MKDIILFFSLEKSFVSPTSPFISFPIPIKHDVHHDNKVTSTTTTSTLPSHTITTDHLNLVLLAPGSSASLSSYASTPIRVSYAIYMNNYAGFMQVRLFFCPWLHAYRMIAPWYWF
jgi:hypothetical protein